MLLVGHPLDNPADITGWWLWFRRIVTFLLGVAVIVDSLVEKDTAAVGKLIVGLILVGAMPIDDLVRIVVTRRRARNGN